MDGNVDGPNIHLSLIANGIAAGWCLFAALSGILTMVFNGFGIISGFIPFAVVMLMVTVGLAAAGSRIPGPSALLGWNLAVAAAWGLSAPLGTWFWNALERTDSSISLTGPQEFLPQLWLWALIPVGIYVTVGLFRFRKTSVQLA